MYIRINLITNGISVSTRNSIPLQYYPHWWYPPMLVTSGGDTPLRVTSSDCNWNWNMYGFQAGSMHPTGMLSYALYCHPRLENPLQSGAIYLHRVMAFLLFQNRCTMQKNSFCTLVALPNMVMLAVQNPVTWTIQGKGANVHWGRVG